MGLYIWIFDYLNINTEKRLRQGEKGGYCNLLILKHNMWVVGATLRMPLLKEHSSVEQRTVRLLGTQTLESTLIYFGNQSFFPTKPLTLPNNPGKS